MQIHEPISKLSNLRQGWLADPSVLRRRFRTLVSSGEPQNRPTFGNFEIGSRKQLNSICNSLTLLDTLENIGNNAREKERDLVFDNYAAKLLKYREYHGLFFSARQGTFPEIIRPSAFPER
jgi:hypothetical protein